jgi:hypothetical protein
MIQHYSNDSNVILTIQYIGIERLYEDQDNTCKVIIDIGRPNLRAFYHDYLPNFTVSFVDNEYCLLNMDFYSIFLMIRDLNRKGFYSTKKICKVFNRVIRDYI